ncbi:helix-turn-helix domain-containing protein [Cyclobacterium marinum]|uniref:Helix-turn-helix domain protein n=1 Tax=Cyclobacterium marinum (strain ATCC 25205 / DSM 745 / LMG 13164 / NCIMB 1802) TaxID=880070 RepID=G0IXY8_CYCMS|nr:helix-turn-helix transcriptional regulator [Cyclobacterium marinum]AEL24321.1 helix-turn-helix domain protein [Cyclobacterium marinum DSM 745]
MSGNLTIGKRIALLRKARSLTQQRLSELTGKSRGVIAQIEKDMVKPDYEFIGLFVRNLNIPYEWIFEPTETVEDWLLRGVKLPDEIGGHLNSNKGGHLRDHLMPENANEKHIKPKNEPYSQVDTGEVIHEEENTYKKASSEELRKFTLIHYRVMDQLLYRIDELEEKVRTLTPESKK